MAEQQNVPKKVNNQISNTRKIKKLTGYTPGKVYLYDEDKAKNKESFDSVKRWKGTDYLIRGTRLLSRGVYDINTGSFHIVPDDDNTRLEYLDLINKAIHILKPAISERLREILNDPTAKCSCGRGVPRTHLDIEKYINDIGDYVDTYISTYGYDGIESYINKTTLAEKIIESDGPETEIASYDSVEREERIDGVTYYIYRRN